MAEKFGLSNLFDVIFCSFILGFVSGLVVLTIQSGENITSELFYLSLILIVVMIVCISYFVHKFVK